MTWEKTNSSTMSKKETAMYFAEWLWEYQTGEPREVWKKFDEVFNVESDIEEEEEEISTEKAYNKWNKLNNQETN